MDDSPEMIRQQMDETKSQLTEKLETLELQVAGTVQSTATAVTATVEAVHETVDSVTDAVSATARSISDAFDFRRHVEQHPWLVLGGAAIAGYALAKHLMLPPPESGLGNAAPGRTADATPTPESKPSGAALTAAYESGREQSAWEQVKLMAIGVALSVAKDVASRIVPRLIGSIVDGPPAPPEKRPEHRERIRGRPRKNVTPGVPGFPHLASMETYRSRTPR